MSRNAFADIKVTVPRATAKRATKAFREEGVARHPQGGAGCEDTSKPFDAADVGWPWLCAYTGARVGEIAQLRAEDVVTREGVPAINITPEAGTVKTGKVREVPLHEHLIDQGFLEFARSRSGPLFYGAATRKSARAVGGKKPKWAQTRQLLARWVRRAIGVKDTAVAPNHGWRHTFKQLADHATISERTSDYITGHSHRGEGKKYGAPTVRQMADALKGGSHVTNCSAG